VPNWLSPFRRALSEALRPTAEPIQLIERATTAFTDLRLRIQKGEKKWQKLYVAIPQHLREVAGG
jgi:hypothetical protein